MNGWGEQMRGRWDGRGNDQGDNGTDGGRRGGRWGGRGDGQGDDARDDLRDNTLDPSDKRQNILGYTLRARVALQRPKHKGQKHWQLKRFLPLVPGPLQGYLIIVYCTLLLKRPVRTVAGQALNRSMLNDWGPHNSFKYERFIRANVL